MDSGGGGGSGPGAGAAALAAEAGARALPGVSVCTSVARPAEAGSWGRYSGPFCPQPARPSTIAKTKIAALNMGQIV